MKFKVGDKIKIPKQKTFGDLFEGSLVQRYILKHNPKFLYITFSSFSTGKKENVYDIGPEMGVSLNSFAEKDLEFFSKQIMLFEDEL